MKSYPLVAAVGPYEAFRVHGQMMVFRAGRVFWSWPRRGCAAKYAAPEFAMRQLVKAEAEAKAERAARVAYGRERKAAAIAAAAGPEQLKLF